jgi:hypothetical protein
LTSGGFDHAIAFGQRHRHRLLHADMGAAGQRRDRHRLMQRVRRQDFDQVEVGAQDVLEVARRVCAGVFGRATSENGRVGVAQRRNLRLGMIEVAADIEIKYASKADKANA